MSRRLLVTAEPLDSFFFPDHRPFNQDDPGLGEAATRFPPPPHAMAGAVRLAIARRLGWQDEPRDWREFVHPDGIDLGAELGSGPFTAGNLRFGPPQILLGETLLYPVPRYLVGRFDRKGDLADPQRLVPGAPISSDAPFARLPALDHSQPSAFKSLAGWWLAKKGLKDLLDGGQPDLHTLVGPHTITATRPQVGLETDYSRHRAAAGKLYVAAHGELSRRQVPLSFAARLEITASSRLEDIHVAGPMVIPMGAHGRAADIGTLNDQTPPTTGLHAKGGMLRYVVSLLAPAWLHGGPIPHEIQALPGTLVSAVHDRPLVLGAWQHDAVDRRHYQRLHPVGSSWFFEATGDDIDKAKEKAKNWREPGVGIGCHQAVGYGAVVVGSWTP